MIFQIDFHSERISVDEDQWVTFDDTYTTYCYNYIVHHIYLVRNTQMMK